MSMADWAVGVDKGWRERRSEKGSANTLRIESGAYIVYDYVYDYVLGIKDHL